MVSVLIVKETNGALPGVETQLTGDIIFGNFENYVFVPSDYPISPGNNSYEKYIGLEVSDMDGNSALENLRVWKSGGDALGSYTALKTNARESSYVAASYAVPVTTTSTVATQDMPVTEPTGANLGIGGSLSGQLTAVEEVSDYLVSQFQTTSDETKGKTIVLAVSWEEVP